MKRTIMFQSYYGPTGIFSELEVILITSAVDLGYITVFDCKRDASGFYLCFFFILSRNFQSYRVITIATKELQI